MSRFSVLYRAITYILVFVVLLQILCIGIPNGFVAQAETKTFNEVNDTYLEYKNNFADVDYAKESIEIKAKDFSIENAVGACFGEYFEEKDVLLWQNGNGFITYTLKIPEDALYTLSLSYCSLVDTATDIKLGFTIDGEYTDEVFERLQFSTYWENDKEKFSTDNFGNELTPSQVMKKGFVTSEAKDNTGVEIRLYKVYLSAGEHTIGLVSQNSDIALKSVSLTPPESEKNYAEHSSDYKNVESSKNDSIVLQGEKAIDKTSYSIVPKSDNASCSVTPSDARCSLLNYIGGTSWQYSGDALSWDFKIETAGYYKIGFMYKQSDSINRNSYRWIKIDGKTPFAEAREVPFKYTLSWDFKIFGENKDNPYWIWLDEGTHTLTMEVTLGEENAAFYQRMKVITEQLNDIYLEIVKITGSSPDLNRDYELFKQIPDFNHRLEENSDLLMSLAEDMERTENESGSEIVASIKNMSRVLRNMLKNPYGAHEYVSDYYSAYSSISTWLFDMKKMPLAIDEIQITPLKKEFEGKQNSIWDSIWFRFKAFVYSFTKDYAAVSGKDANKESITVWVGWGKDQASALDVMIKEKFTKSKDIDVELKIVSSNLINGLLSGKYPDVQLSLSRTDPVNYGMRGALCDLKQFEDYDEVVERFQKDADVPYQYLGKTYGLPETQTFNIMFYRTDIFDKLGLKVPKTWEEFINVSSVIQRYNMDVYIPYTQIASTAVVNQGIGNLHLLPTLLLQNNLSLYNEKQNATTINNVDTIKIIDEWIKLYTDYKFVKEADFYNRFRMGTMPLGIAPYNVVFNISELAPEVQGKWALATVPTTAEGNGTVAGGGSACVIVEKSSKKDSAWEFLKWWTSADTQYEYSRRVESVLGLVARVTTANREAVEMMDWESEQLDVLLEQWNRVSEIQEVPGSYYLIRSVDQMYWSVINGEMNCMDAVAYWSKEANQEIERKCKEYGKVG